LLAVETSLLKIVKLFSKLFLENLFASPEQEPSEPKLIDPEPHRVAALAAQHLS
jgi:hypothetical protein